MSAQIELPTGAGGWLLSLDEQEVRLGTDGWWAYEGGGNLPLEELFVCRSGFRLSEPNSAS